MGVSFCSHAHLVFLRINQQQHYTIVYLTYSNNEYRTDKPVPLLLVVTTINSTHWLSYWFWTMLRRFDLLLLVILIAYCLGESVGNTTDLTFLIEHKINGVFVPRTKALIVLKPDGKQSLSFPERNGIFEENVEHFKSLLKSNELYTLRLRSADSDSSIQSVITSIPAVSFRFQYV